VGSCAEKDSESVAELLTKQALPSIVRRIGTQDDAHHAHTAHNKLNAFMACDSVSLEAHYAAGRGLEAALDEAFDNAVAAVGKICYYCHKSLSDAELFSTVRSAICASLSLSLWVLLHADAALAGRQVHELASAHERCH
jgi:hypothetical protein